MKNAKVLRNWFDVTAHRNKSPYEAGSFWLPLMAKTTHRLPESWESIERHLGCGVTAG
jgi:hypothetical protein